MSTTNGYTVTAVLPRPNLKLEEGKSYDVLIESEITEEKSPDTWASEPFPVMDVIDLETGEPKRIIPPAQLKIRLEENAPYIDKMYRIQVMGIRGNNQSRDIGLYRIEPSESNDKDG